MKIRLFHYLILLTVTLYSCKTIEPVLPEGIVKTLPPLTQRTSSLSLPIEINLEPYLKEVEKSLPKTMRGSENNCSGVSYAYKFDREPIKFEGKGPYLKYEVNGKYLLNLNYCPECTYMFDNKGTCVIPRIYASCGVGEPMRKASVAYSSKISVSPEFKLNALTELTKFETTDPCEITVFQYDATDKLRKEVTAELKNLEKEIDAQIGEVDIRTDIEEVWEMISTPQPIASYGFLSIQPKEIALSTINFDQKKAQLQLNMTFVPQVTLQAPESKSAPLPKLSEFKKGNGFEINLDILATYDSLTSILSKELAGKSILIKKNLVVFDSVGIESAAGNKLNFRVAFSGKRKGTLFMVGTPVFDSVSQIISFPDMQFDLETKNALLKTAKWLFNPKITDLMRQKATFDLIPHLSTLQKQLEKEVNREISKGIDLRGSIYTVSVGSIHPLTDKLVVRVHAGGKLSLKM